METAGLIIKTANYGEGSRIVTILTPNGKVQAVANGARSLKSRLFAGSQLFCYSNMVLQKGKGELSYLKSCDIIENFYNLRMDIVKVSMCTYFCELLELMASGEDCTDILRLALNAMYMVGKLDDFMYVKPVFELRLITLLGFMPGMDRCIRCGREGDFTRFSSAEGGVLCDECGDGTELGRDVISAMSYIINADDNKYLSFSVSKQVEQRLWNVCEEQVLYHLEYKPKKLSYLYALL